MADLDPKTRETRWPDAVLREALQEATPYETGCYGCGQTFSTSLKFSCLDLPAMRAVLEQHEADQVQALTQENARLKAENALLIETSDMPSRQKRLRLHMDRVVLEAFPWTLHYCQTRSIHQGQCILYHGEKVVAVGTREWCDRKMAEGVDG